MHVEKCGWLLFGMPLPAKTAAFDFLKGTGHSVVESGEDRGQIFLEDVPINRRQHHDCNAPPGKVLLVRKGLVAGDEGLETVSLGCFQKLAILQPRPVFIPDRENIMAAEVVPQQMWEVF